MKKTIIGIALAFCLLLTACSVHAKSDTESITEAAAISSISDDHNKSPKRECNGYIVLETSLSLSKEDVTDKQFSDAEKILNLLDSKDKSMMNSLSIGKEKHLRTELSYTLKKHSAVKKYSCGYIKSAGIFIIRKTSLCPKQPSS